MCGARPSGPGSSPWPERSPSRSRVYAAFGFNWLTGLAQLRIRYYQGIASQRPFSYFVYAEPRRLADQLFAAAGGRDVAGGRRRSPGGAAPWSPDRTVAVLALSGVLAALLADLSGLSKAETERIWLTFGVIAYSGLALLRGRAAVVGTGWAAQCRRCSSITCSTPVGDESRRRLARASRAQAGY